MSEIFRTVDSLNRAMDYHLERHNVLASNVANIDTPGFQPLEFVRAPESGVDGTLPMQGTSEAHLGTPASGPTGEIVQLAENIVQPGGDGNSVSLEREMSKLAANDIRYDAATRIVRQQLGMLRYAASDATSG